MTDPTEQRQGQPQNWGQIAITGTRRDSDEFGRSCSDPNFAAASAVADLKSASAPNKITPIVLDTNIVLDLYVFKNPATIPLQASLEKGIHRWIATQPMRDELERVLAYLQIAPRLAFYQLTASDVLAQFDMFTQLEPIAPKASVTCKDVDDQKFVDLAVQYRAVLLSKDNAVLCMAKRLLASGVITGFAI